MLHVVERLLVCDVVDNDDAVGTAVVAARDGSEALLGGGIPDLQLHGLAIQFEGADLEVHADGTYVALSVGVVCETEEQAGLADTRVANEEQLEEVVILRLHVRRFLSLGCANWGEAS